MDFLDEATITVRSGDGGKGCISFRRERFLPKGGPDGGDGGDGGSVYAHATSGLQTLSDYRSKRYLKAANGQPGSGKSRSGKNGKDVVLELPLGTIIRDLETDELIADLTEDDSLVLILEGGMGGRGNEKFASSTNRTPRFAQPGTPGLEKRLKLTLKYLADIGLIGLPNAGKSTLLSRLSMARPKIASYPFTTLTPNLGVMNLTEERFLVIADIPGLIKGASHGKGLGLQFLKHIERTRLLIHMLDVTSLDEDDPIAPFRTVREEMSSYNAELESKPCLVLLNKIDVTGRNAPEIGKIRQAFDEMGIDCILLSALIGEGVDELRDYISDNWS